MRQLNRRCPHCGTANHQNSMICRGCAATLPRGDEVRTARSGVTAFLLMVLVMGMLGAGVYLVYISGIVTW